MTSLSCRRSGNRTYLASLLWLWSCMTTVRTTVWGWVLFAHAVWVWSLLRTVVAACNMSDSSEIQVKCVDYRPSYRG